MKQHISQNQKQSQIVSQSQVQFLNMLNMNNHELETWMLAQYMENPFLEKNETEKSNDTSSFSASLPYSVPYAASQETDTHSFREPAIYEGQQIFHYLTEQLRYSDYSNTEWKTFIYLIENLDEKGYFTLELDTVAKQMDISLNTAKKCLNILQELEPYGIFSPNMANSFIKQLEKRKIHNEKLIKIISDHLDDLLYKKYAPLQKKYKISKQTIEDYHRILSELNPYPLVHFQTKDAPPILPDILCHIENGVLVPRLNMTTNYDYSLSDYYLKMMQQAEHEDLKKYLHTKYTIAKNILINIENREKTLLHITECLLKKQSAFFLRKGALIPMSMSQVAEICGVSTSTVSRAIRDKYLQYPGGTILMKNLFVSAADTTERTDASLSADDIKKLIAQMIQMENPKKPLSDDEISSLLNEENISISRRTVAKYRTEMLIPTSRERRVLR